MSSQYVRNAKQSMINTLHSFGLKSGDFEKAKDTLTEGLEEGDYEEANERRKRHERNERNGNRQNT